MGPKKKGNGKKGQEKKDMVQKPTKSEYLAKIAEMNNILAQVRKETSLIESVYTDTENQYEQVQKDMDDIIKYLEYETKFEKNRNILFSDIEYQFPEILQVYEEEIARSNSVIENYTKEMQKQNKYYDGIFYRMDEEYELKSRQLTEKIQSVNAKLNSFEEMRRQREDYQKRKETLTILVQEMSIRQNEEIYDAEKQAIIDQDTFQKEIENKLDQLALDFRKATDIRIGETTNRIIGENIKLGNMLTCQQQLMTQIRDNYTDMKNFQRKAVMDLELKQDEYNLVFERYSHNSNKILELLQLAEDLTKKIEDLKKLIKVNRTLKRKIIELECYYKELTEEYDLLEKSLEDMEELTTGAKGNFYHYERAILKLQIILFEAAKKVMEAIECEYATLPIKEKIAYGGKEGSQSDLAELEEEREQAYTKRESLIAEIWMKLRSAIFSTDELNLTASSTESYDINSSYITASFEHTPTSKRSIEKTDNEHN